MEESQNKDVINSDNDRELKKLDPTPTQTILLGIYHIIWAVICVYLAITKWPELFGKDPVALKDMIYLVLLAGAIGSFIHSANSFIGFVGNNNLKINWFWWYIFRPFIGMTVALVFFILFHTDQLNITTATSVNESGSISDKSHSEDSTIAANAQLNENEVPSIEFPGEDSVITSNGQLNKEDQNNSKGADNETNKGSNPYGFLVLCMLAGMFSDMATHKLKEIAKSLFNYQDERQNKMNDAGTKTNDFENPTSQG